MVKSQTRLYSDELKERMRFDLLKLKGDGASEEEIKKCKRGYRSIIREEVAAEKKEKTQVRVFQEVLNKRRCATTERKIRQIFFTVRSINKTCIPAVLPMKAVWAMEALKARHRTKQLSKNTNYQKSHRKLLKLRGSLLNVFQLMNDDDIYNFYITRAYKDNEVSPEAILSTDLEFVRQVARRGFDLDMIIYKEKRRGRPSYTELYSYVYHLAQIYEDLTGLEFTLDKYRPTSGPERGQYLPITPGHRFVCEAVRWMHEEFSDPNIKPRPEYTSANVYNACDNARKQLRAK